MFAEHYRWGPHSATDNEFEARQFRRLLKSHVEWTGGRPPWRGIPAMGIHRPSDIIYMLFSMAGAVTLIAQVYVIYLFASARFVKAVWV